MKLLWNMLLGLGDGICEIIIQIAPEDQSAQVTANIAAKNSNTEYSILFEYVSTIGTTKPLEGGRSNKSKIERHISI